jgi:hypothetical protein
MGKRKPPRHIRDKTPPLRTQATESTFVKSHRRLLEILGGIATLLTIAAFYLSYLVPKLSVDSTGSLQPTSPMGTMFYLSNDGSLPIHDVEVTLGNVEIAGQNLKVLGLGMEYAASPEAKADILSPGHKMTLPYAPAFGFAAVSNLTGARLVIRVHYRPDYIAWRKTAVFPFQAIRAANGTWIWRSIPQ